MSKAELPLKPLDHGCLPPWKSGPLPAPEPFSVRGVLRTIGPGAILLAGSIGGGEWIAGPLMAVTYGRGILWIASAAILLQMVLNLEAIRYTMYTGEPVITGFMRLRPGPWFWAAFYIGMSVAQLATPALALGCANVLFAAAGRRLPESQDSATLTVIALTIMFATAVLLLSGKSIERLLERLSWAMVALIFSFLLIVNVLFVPWEGWYATGCGFLSPAMPPADVDILLLATFAATAGSGGVGNLAISNWYRDKGFGMGAHMGGIGGVLAAGHTELEPVGRVFEISAESMRHWRGWWKYCYVDQIVLWGGGCAVGMFLNVNLAAAIVPAGKELSGYAAGAFQAQFMAERLWFGFWYLCLLNGFWILLSTHIGNTDCLTRTVTDVLWGVSPRLTRFKASRLYAVLLAAFLAWGTATLFAGKNALALFKVLGVMASPIMAVAALQILRVNRRFLPRELRPSLLSRIGLVAVAVVYALIAAASAKQLVQDFLLN